MKTNTFRCFGIDNPNGADATVIEDEGWNSDMKQRIAHEIGRTACVFYRKPENAIEKYVLDFFYPHAHSRLCLHAAMAFGWLITETRPDLQSFSALTIDGQELTIVRSGDELCLMSSPKFSHSRYQSDRRILSLIGIREKELASQPILVDVGVKKLIVEINDLRSLNALDPDLSSIVKWGKSAGISGCFVYVKKNSREFVGRNFNHLQRSLEDPATGVAALCLAAFYGETIRLHQGANQGNPCQLVAGVSGKLLWVSGAVTESSTSIN